MRQSWAGICEGVIAQHEGEGEGVMISTLGAAAVLADSDKGKGSPIGLFVVLLLVVAVYFLYRSMSKHIRRVPESFQATPGAEPSGVEPTAEPESWQRSVPASGAQPTVDRESRRPSVPPTGRPDGPTAP